MSDNDVVELAATQAPGAAPADATLPASGGGANAADATLAASSGGAAAVVVRSGGQADFPNLRPVDPVNYVIGQELAKGGMGRIMTARDRRLGRPVAIKELLVNTGDLAARFEREARITATLQHPSIVNVLEAGTWPSGEPFYVMKLVTGESLDKAIAMKPTLAERLSLLPSVIACVDALAYAHSKHVIHRDLKPANVLVGEFGETVVIDWGLAKDLSDTSGAPDAPAGPVRTTASAPGATVAGSVMGTPAYMPPEQAMGELEQVDERADVYSLGALLYHVLAGVAPYIAKTTDATLARVIEGPPEPLVTRVPEVPADLVAIVTKAMARERADRYPTAKQLADDLKKFQTGNLVGAHRYSTWQLLRRWLRRHRTAVAVAAIAALLLIGVGVISVRGIVHEQARTNQQRQVAELNRGEAEDLLSFMLGDLRAKLEPLGKLELLHAVADKAVSYYRARPPSETADEEAKRATAFSNIGEVLLGEGHADAAVKAQRTALGIRVTMAAISPGDLARRNAVANSHWKLGVALVELGDSKTALDEFHSARTIQEDLIIRDAANTAWQQSLAQSHEKIGDMLFAKGDNDGGLAEYRAEMAICERLAKAHPDDLTALHNLAVSHDHVGTTLITRGDLKEALAEYRAMLALAEKVAAGDPTNLGWARAVSVAHDRVGLALEGQGDFPGALAEFRAGLPIRERFAAHDPTNGGWQRDLAVSHTQLAQVHQDQGHYRDALAEARAAIAVSSKLVDQAPANATWQALLSECHIHAGRALSQLHDPAGAIAEYKVALVTQEQLAKRDPSAIEYMNDIAFVRDRIASEMLKQGDKDAALGELRAIVALWDRFAAADPTNTKAQQGLALGHESIANALAAKGDTDGALAEYRASATIIEPIAARTQVVDLIHTVLVEHYYIAGQLKNKGDLDGALRELAIALKTGEDIAARSPDSAPAASDIADLHTEIGDVSLKRGDKPAALAAYRAALAIEERLVQKAPDNADYRKAVDTLPAKLAAASR